MITTIEKDLNIDLTNYSELMQNKIKEWVENNPMTEDVWKHITIDGKDVFVSKYGNVKILFSKQKYQVGKNGYTRLNIRGRTFCIQRLVAYAWGLLKTLQYDNNLDVDHIDENKKNNTLNNLRVISHKDNIIYRDRNGSARNKAIKAINIKNGNEMKFKSLKEAAEKLNLCSSSICNVLKGKNKKTGDYKFEYCEKYELPNNLNFYSLDNLPRLDEDEVLFYLYERGEKNEN